MTKEQLQQAIEKEKINENLDENLVASLQQMMDKGDYEAENSGDPLPPDPTHKPPGS